MIYRNHAEEIAALRAAAEADDWHGFHASGVPTEPCPCRSTEWIAPDYDDGDSAARMLGMVLLICAAVGLALIGWTVWAVL